MTALRQRARRPRLARRKWRLGREEFLTALRWLCHVFRSGSPEVTRALEVGQSQRHGTKRLHNFDHLPDLGFHDLVSRNDWKGQGLRSRFEAKVRMGWGLWATLGSRAGIPHRQRVQLAMVPSSSSSSPGVSVMEPVSLAGRLAVGRERPEVKTQTL